MGLEKTILGMLKENMDGLTKLLEEPEPGLSTWIEPLQKFAGNIAQFASTEDLKEIINRRDNENN